MRPPLSVLRAPLAAIALAAGLWAATAAPASATVRDVWSFRACSEGYLSQQLYVPPAGSAWRLKLRVHHVPGSFGTLQVRYLSDGDHPVLWEFTQPWSWIFGDYEVESGHLPVGDYRLEYWANNRAQDRVFCHFDLRLENTTHRRR